MDNETFNFFEMGILDAPPEKVEEKETSKQNSNSQKGKNTKKQVNIPQTSSSSKLELENYKEEIIIKAYGNELFRMPGPITEDQLLGELLVRVRHDYGLPEFQKERTQYLFCKETGIVCLQLKFHKKG